MSVTQQVESAPSPVRLGRVLPPLGLAALVAVMDGTIVAVALERIAGELGTTLATAVWITVGYLLAAATTLPLLGILTARLGGRRVFLLGLAVFLLGSVLCLAAPSIGVLVAARVVQGLGGGLLEPSSLALAASLADARTVGRVLGTMSLIINIAPVLGPVLGAVLLDVLSWRWLFAINLPLGAVVLVATLLLVPADRPGPSAPVGRPDVRGLGLLTPGYVLLLLALNRSGQDGQAWLVVVCLLLAVGLLGGYVRHALSPRTAEPALDLRLLRTPGFAACLGVMGLVGLIMFSQLTALPLFAEQQHDLTGVGRGLFVCALGVGLFVSMPNSARLSDRFGPRPLVGAGSIGTFAGLGAFAAWHDSLPLAAVVVLFVGIGLCFGCTAAPTFASVYRVLRPADQAHGTTALFMTVQLTASLGVTLLALLSARTPQHWLTALFAIAAGAAAGIGLLSRLLPGRPGSAGQAGT